MIWFWIDFLTILGPSWGPCGVPFGLWDATGTFPKIPRRSQEAPKMLPRRSRMPTRHPKRPQEGPTPLQARFCTIFQRIFIICSSMFFIDFSWFFYGFFIDVLICWDYSGSILELFWKYSGIILRLFWEYSGSTLGVFWQYFGLSWEYARSVLGIIGKHSVADG